MAFLEDYHNQVALLLRTIPFVAAEPDFALKGGTAINLFVRDMPRLSVDIDLTYLPVADHTVSLAAIDAGMERIAQRIEAGIPGVHVARSRLQKEGIVTRLVIRDGTTQIKIEVTPVLRGAVYETVETDVSALVEDTFGYARISHDLGDRAWLSFDAIYAHGGTTKIEGVAHGNRQQTFRLGTSGSFNFDSATAISAGFTHSVAKKSYTPATTTFSINVNRAF